MSYAYINKVKYFKVFAPRNGGRVDGTDQDDVITGFTGHDLIYAGAGNDRITTNQGNDTIYAGAGNDIILSGIGNDVIYGGEGNDQLIAGSGDDFLFGGDGDDTLSGDLGNDYMSGGAGNDLLSDGWDPKGVDTFNFNFTNNNGIVNSGDGHDTILHFFATDRLEFKGMTQEQFNDQVIVQRKFANNDTVLDTVFTLESDPSWSLTVLGLAGVQVDHAAAVFFA